MKTEATEVKSNNVVVSTIEIPVFESLKEAIDQLTEEACLKLINRRYRQDLVTAERSAKTRPTTLEHKIAQAVKGKSREEIEAMIDIDALGLDRSLLDSLPQW